MSLDFNNLPAPDKLYYLDADSGIAIYRADNRVFDKYHHIEYYIYGVICNAKGYI
jgi:hypothetical protein